MEALTRKHAFFTHYNSNACADTDHVESIFCHDSNIKSLLGQSRSQSMPVRGLVVGIALAKPNEICNFIGCREINETDIESKR